MLLDEIRSIPGLDGFASGVEFADVFRAVTETPIVYVNPTPWGTDSTLEQQAIATLPWNRFDCWVGSAATTHGLRRGGVVHVACPARAALTDLDDVGLRLRDAALKLQQLAALDATNVRLVTLSACQTALTPLAHESEGFSIAVVLQAAGAGRRHCVPVVGRRRRYIALDVPLL